MREVRVVSSSELLFRAVAKLCLYVVVPLLVIAVALDFWYVTVPAKAAFALAFALV